MKFKDYFNIDVLFHPPAFYDSDWFLNGVDPLTGQNRKYLLLNSKKQHNRNLYEEYLQRYYYQPLNNIFNSPRLAFSFEPEIGFTISDDGQKRVTRFCLITYLMQMISSLNLIDNALDRFANDINGVIDRNEQIIVAKELVRLECKCYQDIATKANKSEHYNKALDVYKLYSNYYHEKFSLSFEEFIQEQIYTLQRLMIGSRYYLEVFNKEINTSELVECFDYDKFCLIAAMSALDSSHMTERIHGLVDNSVSYLKTYVDAVREYRASHPHYNCTMLTEINSKKKKVIVDIDYVIKEYEALLARHPEFSFVEIQTTKLSSLAKYCGQELDVDNLDLSSKSSIDLLEPMIKKFMHDKELAASWEFIPRAVNQGTNDHSTQLKETHSHVSFDEYVRRMIVGRDFLENSDYLYKLYGLNKFEGYIGYVYANGCVIFEKYYENIRTKRIAKESATYAMSIYNFLELSRLNRLDIVRKLKNERLTDVKRIFHGYDMKKWESEVMQAISGNDYTEEVINYINSLVNDNVLTHDSKKEVYK